MRFARPSPPSSRTSRTRGDAAVRQYSETFDGWSPDSFRLDAEEIEKIVAGVPDQVIEDITAVQERVRRFAQHQKDSLTDFEVETVARRLPRAAEHPRRRSRGVRPGRAVPARRVGAHDRRDGQGGRRRAGDRLHTADPGRDSRRRPSRRCTWPAPTRSSCSAVRRRSPRWPSAPRPSARWTCCRPGQRLRRRGQAAAVRRGRHRPVRRPDRDPDRGRRRRRPLRRGRRPAQPGRARPGLARGAHHHLGAPWPAGRSSWSSEILLDMPTADFAGPAWRDHGQVAVVDDLDEAYALADRYASEHVQILTGNPREALDKMRNYGAIFLGEGTCVSYGDKVIGTNHMLPTRRRRAYTGGLWVGQVPQDRHLPGGHRPAASAGSGELCGRAARVELFEGHARSGDVRAHKYAGARCRGHRPACEPAERCASTADRDRRADGARHGRRQRPRPGDRARPARRRARGSSWPAANADEAGLGRRPRSGRTAPGRGRRRRRRASVAALAAWLADEDVSILVNNAGIAGPVAPLVDVSRRRLGRGLRRQRPRRVPDVPGVPARPMVARGAGRHHQPRLGERQAPAGPPHPVHRVEDGGHRADRDPGP